MPVVILATITVVLIMMFLYEESVTRSNIHMALRCQAGLISERTVYYNADGDSLEETFPSHFWDGDIKVKGGLPFKEVSAIQEISMIERGILHREGSSTVDEVWHVSNGVKYLNARDAAGK